MENTTKKMYKEPKIETMPMLPASVICVSADGRTGVNSNTEEAVTNQKIF